MALSDGLIAGWNFNELSGVDCADIQETYDGTASGASVDTGLKKLGAASRIFDGLNDQINIGISPFFQESATALTISTWIYVDAFDYNNTLIALADTASGSVIDGGLLLLLDDRGGSSPREGLTFAIRTIGGNEVRRSNSLIISGIGWRHIVVSYDSTDFSRIYVNNSDETGVRVSSGSGSFAPKNFNLRFGEANTGQWDFEGNFDSTYFWNRAITVSEINELWNGGAGLELSIGEIISPLRRGLGRGLNRGLGKGL